MFAQSISIVSVGLSYEAIAIGTYSHVLPNIQNEAVKAMEDPIN